MPLPGIPMRPVDQGRAVGVGSGAFPADLDVIARLDRAWARNRDIVGYLDFDPVIAADAEVLVHPGASGDESGRRRDDAAEGYLGGATAREGLCDSHPDGRITHNGKPTRREMRTLRTPHLTMEPVGPENAREMWRLLQKPHLRDFQDIPRLAFDELERQIRLRPRRLSRGAKGRFEWLLRAPDFGGYVGWVSLRVNERTPQVGEIGYSLIVEARGQGLATEAVRALVDEVFTATDLAEIQACCLPENVRSRAVLARLGFRETRTIPGGAIVRGRRVTVVEHQLHRGEWTARRRARILGRQDGRP